MPKVPKFQSRNQRATGSGRLKIYIIMVALIKNWSGYLEGVLVSMGLLLSNSEPCQGIIRGRFHLASELIVFIGYSNFVRNYIRKKG